MSHFSQSSDKHRNPLITAMIYQYKNMSSFTGGASGCFVRVVLSISFRNTAGQSANEPWLYLATIKINPWLAESLYDTALDGG